MTIRRILTWLVPALVLVAACTPGTPSALQPLPKPDDVALETVTTAVQKDLADVDLPKARGATTTTVRLGPGPLTLRGIVQGPDGPVAGAAVRVERLVSGNVAKVDLVTLADGTWELPKVLGGRYRVRAWLAPSLAMDRAKVFFVGTTLADAIVLRIDRFEGRTVSEAIAPSPPPLGQPAELRVRVMSRTVGPEGRVRNTPVAGVQAALSGTGQWQADTDVTTVTDADGVAVWQVRCSSSGHQPLTVVLDGVETIELQIADCVDYSTTTTASTVPTSSTVPGSPTTSTTVHR